MIATTQCNSELRKNYNIKEIISSLQNKYLKTKNPNYLNSNFTRINPTKYD